jgi:hypothetical protein
VTPAQTPTFAPRRREGALGHGHCPLEFHSQEPDVRTPSTGNAAPPEPSQKPAETDTAQHARSETAANVAGRPAPRLPHERDESSDSGVGAPNDLMRRAHDDAVSGRPGTDKGEATDAVYRRNLRDDTPGSERD